MTLSKLLRKFRKRRINKLVSSYVKPMSKRNSNLKRSNNILTVVRKRKKYLQRRSRS